jgi:hypothetical protein
MENNTYEISNEIEKLNTQMWVKVVSLSSYDMKILLGSKVRWSITYDVWEEVHEKVLAEIKKELTYGKYQR